MDSQHFEQTLSAKQADLKSQLSKLQGDARDAGEAEVRDSSDDATAAQGASEAFEESAIVSGTLEQVEEALARLKDGTFGECLDCGRPIQPARLEAIPWAQYCLEDQERRDNELNVPQGSTL